MAGLGRAARLARRAWPVALEAWRRWDRLSDAEKERYKRQARAYAERSRTVFQNVQKRRRGGR